jgi:hypothetical protein
MILFCDIFTIRTRKNAFKSKRTAVNIIMKRIKEIAIRKTSHKIIGTIIIANPRAIVKRVPQY